MSKKETIDITCPKCGKVLQFTMWSSINTTLDPEMKNKVKTGEAFLFTCPECEDKNMVDYGFLYHQMEERFMIQYANSEENFDEAVSVFKTILSDDDKLMEIAQDGYRNRIVRSKNEVLEKIAIFDAGLDDRVIEICKFFFSIKVKEEIESEILYALYYKDHEGNNYIECRCEDGNVATVEVTDEIYNDVLEMYQDCFPQEPEANIVVDSEWALNVLRAKRDGQEKAYE